MTQRLGNREIPTLELLGDGAEFIEQITKSVTVTPIFSEFTHDEVKTLVEYVQVFRVQPEVPFIYEGDRGSFMAFVLEGKVDISKRHADGRHKIIATVGAGKTLGEMAIVDEEPRFATCVGSTPVTFWVLSHDNFVRILKEHPNIGSKILWQLVMLLNGRVRQLSTKLLQYI
jgi:CRP/FNR family transcriptional regulator, cyclic AMP receptor protein